MARSGRPRSHDAKADELRQAITYSPTDEAIKALHHCDLNIPDGDARTPLIHAVLAGKMPVAAWLVANGANVNQQDRNGWTALHFAVQEKREDLVTFLLDNHAEVDIKDIHGNTPLWRAVYSARGQYALVRKLLQHKADPNTKNESSRSALDLAVQFGDKTLEELLKTG